MTERRQALFQSAATLLFFTVISASFLLSVVPNTQPALSGSTTPFVLLLLSTTALVLAPYRRRDHTSPRRIGRRI